MSTKKILIIDDDEHLLLGLAAKLKANGYAVVSAMDGVAAMAVARQELPDLILLDLGLPAGDGFLILERLKAMTDLMSTPVIVLSARDPVNNKERALRAGAIAYFQKPPDNREFLAAIRHALGEEVAMSQFLKT
ncbi:MAG TPA: response regulator transcription factor [Candidatus Acidoferrales bacterium]|nr:response regulator transcription factor [Candidatus Acidoferrales bacterium]